MATELQRETGQRLQSLPYRDLLARALRGQKSQLRVVAASALVDGWHSPDAPDPSEHHDHPARTLGILSKMAADHDSAHKFFREALDWFAKSLRTSGAGYQAQVSRSAHLLMQELTRVQSGSIERPDCERFGESLECLDRINREHIPSQASHWLGVTYHRLGYYAQAFGFVELAGTANQHASLLTTAIAPESTPIAQRLNALQRLKRVTQFALDLADAGQLSDARTELLDELQSMEGKNSDEFHHARGPDRSEWIKLVISCMDRMAPPCGDAEHVAPLFCAALSRWGQPATPSVRERWAVLLGRCIALTWRAQAESVKQLSVPLGLLITRCCVLAQQLGSAPESVRHHAGNALARTAVLDLTSLCGLEARYDECLEPARDLLVTMKDHLVPIVPELRVQLQYFTTRSARAARPASTGQPSRYGHWMEDLVAYANDETEPNARAKRAGLAIQLVNLAETNAASGPLQVLAEVLFDACFHAHARPDDPTTFAGVIESVREHAEYLRKLRLGPLVDVALARSVRRQIATRLVVEGWQLSAERLDQFNAEWRELVGDAIVLSDVRWEVTLLWVGRCPVGELAAIIQNETLNDEGMRARLAADRRRFLDAISVDAQSRTARRVVFLRTLFEYDPAWTHASFFPTSPDDSPTGPVLRRFMALLRSQLDEQPEHEFLISWLSAPDGTGSLAELAEAMEHLCATTTELSASEYRRICDLLALYVSFDRNYSSQSCFLRFGRELIAAWEHAGAWEAIHTLAVSVRRFKSHDDFVGFILTQGGNPAWQVVGSLPIVATADAWVNGEAFAALSAFMRGLAQRLAEHACDHEARRRGRDVLLSMTGGLQAAASRIDRRVVSNLALQVLVAIVSSQSQDPIHPLERRLALLALNPRPSALERIPTHLRDELRNECESAVEFPEVYRSCAEFLVTSCRLSMGQYPGFKDANDIANLDTGDLYGLAVWLARVRPSGANARLRALYREPCRRCIDGILSTRRANLSWRCKLPIYTDSDALKKELKGWMPYFVDNAEDAISSLAADSRNIVSGPEHDYTAKVLRSLAAHALRAGVPEIVERALSTALNPGTPSLRGNMFAFELITVASREASGRLASALADACASWIPSSGASTTRKQSSSSYPLVRILSNLGFSAEVGRRILEQTVESLASRTSTEAQIRVLISCLEPAPQDPTQQDWTIQIISRLAANKPLAAVPEFAASCQQSMELHQGEAFAALLAAWVRLGATMTHNPQDRAAILEPAQELLSDLARKPDRECRAILSHAVDKVARSYVREGDFVGDWGALLDVVQDCSAREGPSESLSAVWAAFVNCAFDDMSMNGPEEAVHAYELAVRLDLPAYGAQASAILGVPIGTEFTAVQRSLWTWENAAESILEHLPDRLGVQGLGFPQLIRARLCQGEQSSVDRIIRVLVGRPSTRMVLVDCLEHTAAASDLENTETLVDILLREACLAGADQLEEVAGEIMERLIRSGEYFLVRRLTRQWVSRTGTNRGFGIAVDNAWSTVGRKLELDGNRGRTLGFEE